MLELVSGGFLQKVEILCGSPMIEFWLYKMTENKSLIETEDNISYKKTNKSKKQNKKVKTK